MYLEEAALYDPTFSTNNNCGYNMAYYALNHLATAKEYPEELVERDLDPTSRGKFVAFDQTPFSTPEAKMDYKGYLYVPESCENGDYCSLLVYLHGCFLSGAVYNDVHARSTGLLEYAATNNIVVLFP